MTPVPVTGLTSATAITTGGSHSCALGQNGTVSCWGNNQSGQLGNGTLSSRSTPAPVTGLAGITTIIAGLHHSCAVKQNTTVAC
ncbi:MAG: hypothetical protein IPQ14_00030 [Candidatus Microthrix sp.]|nr:hypothetical protein [Candidatus Microthrix sp.]MBL0202744.1 hypothetical protein [Candidatus Microthrix sp.]